MFQFWNENGDLPTYRVQYKGAPPLPHRLAEEALLRAAFSAFLPAAQHLLSIMGALQGKQNSAFSEWMYPRIRRGGRVDKQLRILVRHINYHYGGGAIHNFIQYGHLAIHWIYLY